MALNEAKKRKCLIIFKGIRKLTHYYNEKWMKLNKILIKNYNNKIKNFKNQKKSKLSKNEKL